MPQLKDMVSKFTISPELQHQEPYRTVCLKWMQDNPAQTKNTSVAQMARTMALGGVTTQKEANIAFTIQNMVNRGMITYNGAPRSRRKTFFINYLHKNIPPEIISRAPKGDIKKHEDLAGIKLTDQQFSYNSEPTPTEEAPAPSVEAVKPEPEVPVPEPKVPEMNIPIELDQMPNGNLTLQLNINITISGKK